MIRIVIALIASLSINATLAGRYEDGVAAHGRGEYATAIKLWRSLAELGDSYAQFNLGIVYENGQGVPKDYAKAVHWYKLAAQQGDDGAQSNLGVMYSTGRGVPQDYVRAHLWFNLSAAQGNSKALKNRDTIAKRMTPQQIAEAQKMVSECLGSNYKKCDDAAAMPGPLTASEAKLEPGNENTQSGFQAIPSVAPRPNAPDLKASSPSTTANSGLGAPAEISEVQFSGKDIQWLNALKPAHFVVSHGSFHVLGNAQKLKGDNPQLQKARIVPVLISKKMAYAVITGPFRTRDQANEHLKNLDWSSTGKVIGVNRMQRLMESARKSIR